MKNFEPILDAYQLAEGSIIKRGTRMKFLNWVCTMPRKKDTLFFHLKTGYGLRTLPWWYRKTN
jgi:hypothetical protein